MSGACANQAMLKRAAHLDTRADPHQRVSGELAPVAATRNSDPASGIASGRRRSRGICAGSRTSRRARAVSTDHDDAIAIAYIAPRSRQPPE